MTGAAGTPADVGAAAISGRPPGTSARAAAGAALKLVGALQLHRTRLRERVAQRVGLRLEQLEHRDGAGSAEARSARGRRGRLIFLPRNRDFRTIFGLSVDLNADLNASATASSGPARSAMDAPRPAAPTLRPPVTTSCHPNALGTRPLPRPPLARRRLWLQRLLPLADRLLDRAEGHDERAHLHHDCLPDVAAVLRSIDADARPQLAGGVPPRPTRALALTRRRSYALTSHRS